uniref:Uncharacterized protein n=1 Tax=Arundo donax TaxID=35708 RepID=A0A0A8YEA5_ARUDO
MAASSSPYSSQHLDQFVSGSITLMCLLSEGIYQCIWLHHHHVLEQNMCIYQCHSYYHFSRFPKYRKYKKLCA